ncbi:P-loop containing nucleoside triphosphate hydrolase [Glarea lozoyensis ATCC 20868]|uniref:ATP-dependent RNA helicase n=1 Tax=Glarea lozoyensis (strain ATCC 20868 / MF5171) TaxID=1116229 RepID=S3DMH8_GLAL2|nr:P-loop containing nucleoside triphosphate hydrolase [Glarea lozoyensis ATCC 20868]EPE33271.1 P-loop containing nucleoside triphosphate hydrolase [Glarea lozoyensis ATCC 20868]
MSAQIYSRYVPPAKKQKLDSKPLVVASEPALEVSKVTPPTPAIQHDASATYARYVPASKPKSKSVELLGKDESMVTAAITADNRPNKRDVPQLDDSVAQSSPKKAKKDKRDKKDKRSKGTKKEKDAESNDETGEQDLLDGNGEEKNGNEAEPIKKKKRKEKSTNNDTPLDNMEGVEPTGETEGEATHKRLMAKREKSLRKAEKLAKREAEKDTAEVPPEEEEQLHDLIPLPQPEPVPQLPIQSLTTSLPPWLASPIRVSPATRLPFADVGVPAEAIPILSSKGFHHAFAVQSAVLPILLPGPAQRPGDILVSAATGSGKTLAYVLPMIEEISKTVTTRLRCLVVVPTRELVLQARDVAEICASAFTNGSRRRVKIATAVGSESLKSEQASIMKQELRYDPEKYRAEEKRLNSKWESSDEDGDEDEEQLYVEERVSTLEDHVITSQPKVDILICTPGRLVEHLKSTPGFSLEYVNWLVVDEADKLLDQSFQQWLGLVIGSLEKERRVFQKRPNHVRKIILSATMTRDIGQLSGLKLYRPHMVVLESATAEDTAMTDVSHGHVLPELLLESGIKVEDESIKPLYLMEVLRREGLVQGIFKQANDASDSSSDSSDSDSDSDDTSSSESDTSKTLVESKAVPPSADGITPRGSLIFTKSNETAVRLGRLVALLDPKSASSIATLTSTTRSSARRASLKAFENGRVSILIASDLVSRGLDLPNLAHVINYDVPVSLSSYVHRVGRTARAGKRGHAWTLFTPSEAWWFWNEIGRSNAVERTAAISRVNIAASQFSEEQKAAYESALEALKLEASTSKRSSLK